jgi:CRP/FNR family transcriptional regulator
MKAGRGAFSSATKPCAVCSHPEFCLACRLAAPETAFASDLPLTLKRVKRTESLYHAGASFDSLYAIRCGFFKSTVALGNGREQVTGFHMAGEILGMDGLDTERYTADTTALEDSEVCVIPHARLEDPVLQRRLFKVMSRELVRDQGVMLLLGSMRSAERLATFLLNLSQRLAARGFSAHDFHLRMQRDEIGSYLGLSLETVSRLFSRFQEEGLVRVVNKHIRIQDIEGLRAATGICPANAGSQTSRDRQSPSALAGTRARPPFAA